MLIGPLSWVEPAIVLPHCQTFPNTVASVAQRFLEGCFDSHRRTRTPRRYFFLAQVLHFCLLLHTQRLQVLDQPSRLKESFPKPARHFCHCSLLYCPPFVLSSYCTIDSGSCQDATRNFVVSTRRYAVVRPSRNAEGHITQKTDQWQSATGLLHPTDACCGLDWCILALTA